MRILLNLSRRQFLNAQRSIEITDEATWNNELLKTRNKLMRYGFQTKLVGHLFKLLLWKWELSTDVTWIAFLLLKGYSVTNNENTELAMLLCACTAALAGKQVHWVVTDEQRVNKLLDKYTALIQILGIEIDNSGITILTHETLALNYLLQSKNSHLKKLFNSSNPTDFALIENIDFWLLEKAFAVVNNENEQIMLHELFLRYKCLAGSLLGQPNKQLKQVYNIVPITLFKDKLKHSLNIAFFQNEESKWQAITNLLIANQKICLITTNSESLEKIHCLVRKLALAITIVKGIQDEFAGDLVVLVDPFPWLKLNEWLQDSSYQIIIIDFYGSLRILQSLEKSPLAIKMLVSIKDKWLQELKIPFLLMQLLKKRTITGKLARWLLNHLIMQIETKQMKLHTEMSRWLKKL